MGEIIVSKKIITLETIIEPLPSTSAHAEITLMVWNIANLCDSGYDMMKLF